MSKALSLKNNSWWKTFVAHALRIWPMLLFALFVHLVTKPLGHSAILALLVRQMFVFTFLLLLLNKVFKALMLNKLVSFFFSEGFLHGSVLDHLNVFGLLLFLYLFDYSSIAVFGNGVVFDFWGLENLSSAVPKWSFFFFFF
jgi:hypothetical protein